MQKESKLLSLDALNCNWSVTRQPETSILTSTWYLGDGMIISLCGVLHHWSIARFGDNALVNFFVAQSTTGKPVRTSNPSSKVFLGTLRNMSPSAPLKVGEMFYLSGILQTGFFCHVELDSFMSKCLGLDTLSRNYYLLSSEAGELVSDMYVEYAYQARPMVRDASDILGG